MSQSVIQRGFSGGELSPALGARADLAKYLSGLSICRNFIVQKQGGLVKRPGLRYVATVKDIAVTPRLIPFIFDAADQNYVLEFGEEYIRFFYHGAPVVVSSVAAWGSGTAYVVGDLVVDGGVNYYAIQAGTNHTPASSPTFWYALTGDIYEIPTAYQAADLAALQWAQSADVLTIVHPSYVPMELQRNAATDWVFVPFVTAPSISAPTGGGGVAGAAGTLTLRYKVTAFKSETFEESRASSTVTIASCAKPTEALPNTITWSTVTGAAEYGIYMDPTNNGIFGFIGVSTGTTFKDQGFQPDYSSTPPEARTLFATTNNYPSVVAYHQQRQWFARTNAEPETVWASRVGAYHNFDIATPLQDDDAVTFALAGNTLNPVGHLVGLKRLVVLTDAGEWTINGDDSGVITPTAINAEQHGYVGAKKDSRTVVVGNALQYVQNRGVVLRETKFTQQSESFAGTDLTIYSGHLFDGYALTDLAFAFQPYAIIWAIRNDGTLLGLTYVPDQEISGWHRHDTGELGNLEDKFEALAVIPDTEAGEDVLYVVVSREIRGATPVTQRYIERFVGSYAQGWAATARPFVPDVTDPEDEFAVDAGLTYDGAPATTFSNLDHLEGECVAILADGVVVSDGDRTNLTTLAAYTVTGGAVTIPTAASVVHVGLPIPKPTFKQLDLDADGTNIRGKKKLVKAVSLLVHGSDDKFKAGPDVDNLEFTYRPEPWEAARDVFTGQLDMNLTTKWAESGSVAVQHTNPRAFCTVGMIVQVDGGG